MRSCRDASTVRLSVAGCERPITHQSDLKRKDGCKSPRNDCDAKNGGAFREPCFSGIFLAHSAMNSI
jgi:hypothetical protein